MVTHANTCFLQILLWERFDGITRRPVEFEAMEMVKTMVRDVRKLRKSHPYIPRA